MLWPTGPHLCKTYCMTMLYMFKIQFDYLNDCNQMIKLLFFNIEGVSWIKVAYEYRIQKVPLFKG